MLPKIISIICSEYNVSEQDISTPIRTGIISECRSMICYVAIWKMRISEEEVGLALNRTPKNCLYLLERARDRIDLYSGDKERFEKIMGEIKE